MIAMEKTERNSASTQQFEKLLDGKIYALNTANIKGIDIFRGARPSKAPIPSTPGTCGYVCHSLTAEQVSIVPTTLVWSLNEIPSWVSCAHLSPTLDSSLHIHRGQVQCQSSRANAMR
jgi:hypothetical protein